MNFFDKLKLMLGITDPTKVDVKANNGAMNEGVARSPIESAVEKGDIKSLNEIKKYTPKSRLLPDALSAAVSLAASAAMVSALVDMGAKPDSDVLRQAANNVMLSIINGNNRDSYKKDIAFLQQNGVRLSHFDRETGRSLYDMAPNMEGKIAWFNLASKEDIGHELRQASSLGNVDKVLKMFEIGGMKVNVNATNSDDVDAMAYAIRHEDTRMAKVLYEKGADLISEDKRGLNAFERASPQMQEFLMGECIKHRDVVGLLAAEKAKVNFNNPNYMIMANDTETATFLAEHGAPLDKAIQEAEAQHAKQLPGKEGKNAKIRAVYLNHLKDKLEGKYQKVGKLKIGPSDYGHDLRQAVASVDIDKTQKLLDSGKVDVNALSKDRHDAMYYAVGVHAMAVAKESKTMQQKTESLALLLYDRGIRLETEDNEGKNTFERADKKMQDLLLLSAVRKGDKAALNAAAKAGCDFDNPVLLDTARDKDIMESIVKNKKKPITREEVARAEEADKNDTDNYYNGDQSTHNRFQVLSAAYAKQEAGKTNLAAKASGKDMG